MKIRDVMHFLGYRPKPRIYPWQERQMEITSIGTIRYAEWQNPRVLSKGTYSCRFTDDDLKEAQAWISPGDLVIDIGAHVGDTTLPIAIAAGPSGATLAFEPNEYVFPVLNANAELLKDFARIIAIQAAVGDEDGKMVFEYGDPAFINGGAPPAHRSGRRPSRAKYAQTVDVVRISPFLDTYRRNTESSRVSFIKIDTEGHDFEVLRGFEAVLLADRPALRSEVHWSVDEDGRKAYYQWLRSLGYVIHAFGSTASYLGREISSEELVSAGHCDIFAYIPDAGCT